MPLTLDPRQLESLSAACRRRRRRRGRARGKTAFREALLFTHRGLSGPAILQISSYWREGETSRFDLLPDVDIAALLKRPRSANGRQAVQTVLGEHLPKRLAQFFAETRWR